MLLAIDVGNSHTVFGVWDGDQWLATWRHQTDVETTEDELAAWLFQMISVAAISGRISQIACASVVPGMNQILTLLGKKYFKCDVLFLTGSSDHGVKVDYNPPNAVGSDRIANAIAALAQYSAPIIVVDFGTATTFDVIDKDSVYVGGAIMAGPITSMQSLVSRTAKLPSIRHRSCSRNAATTSSATGSSASVPATSTSRLAERPTSTSNSTMFSSSAKGSPAFRK